MRRSFFVFCSSIVCTFGNFISHLPRKHLCLGREVIIKKVAARWCIGTYICNLNAGAYLSLRCSKSCTTSHSAKSLSRGLTANEKAGGNISLWSVSSVPAHYRSMWKSSTLSCAQTRKLFGIQRSNSEPNSNLRNDWDLWEQGTEESAKSLTVNGERWFLPLAYFTSSPLVTRSLFKPPHNSGM